MPADTTQDGLEIVTISVYLCSHSAINKTHKKPAWRYAAHRRTDVEGAGQDLAAELYTSLSNIRLEYARGDGMSRNTAVADLLGWAKAAGSRQLHPWRSLREAGRRGQQRV